MSYADDQDVWAQVCADDTAAAAGAAGPGPTGSTTSPETPDDDAVPNDPGSLEKPVRADAAPVRRTDEDRPAEEPRRRSDDGITGIPEVDQIADEARKLIGSLSEKVQDLRRYQEQRTPTPIEEAVRVLAPLRKRNPQVFDHLTRAAVELVRAYQAGVRNQERKWANERARRRERIDLDDDGR